MPLARYRGYVLSKRVSKSGILGGFVFGLLGISAGGIIGSIVTAVIGAVLLLFIVGLIKKA